MCFKSTISLESKGLGEIEAYLFVTNVRGNEHHVTFDLEGFVTKEGKNQGMESVYFKSLTFTPDLSSSAREWITQCYNYALSLDEFEGAIRV